MKAILFALLALALAGLVAAAQPAYKRDIPAYLASKAKIAEDSAVSTALGAVPNGTVTAVELENEHKRLIYSVDIQAPNKTGVEEVHVDAMTGKLLGRHYESAKTEAKEAAAEKKESSPPPRY
jgi:uncharacterized membrane protein YkoI